MSSKISIATYLFRRLRQHGVKTIFGVPGDFTLRTIDHMKAAGIEWVGTCNELNAGYAADGYARIKGLGAIITTYGVGELSAINAIAGSFSEHVPVVHIVGVPNSETSQSMNIVHHALPDRSPDVFAKMHEAVTVGQSFLEGKPSRNRIWVDTTLKLALRYRRPVYMQLPALSTEQMTDPERLDSPIGDSFTTDKLEERTERYAVELVEKLQRARFPLLLVDRSRDMDKARPELNDFVRHSGIPTITMPSGASMVDHDIPNYLGVHSGPVGQIDTMPLIEQADLILAFGPMFSDTQTLGWKTVPNPAKTIQIPNWKFPTDSKTYPPDAMNTNRLLVLLKERLWPASLRLSTNPPPLLESFPDFRKLPQPEITDLTAPINQTSFYTRVNPYLRPHDIILLGNATPILGGRDFILPSPTCRVISSGVAFSIGHMLPAALGAAVAQQRVDPIDSDSTSATTPDSTRGRVVLFDGDGSFQVTVQELSTIIRLRLNVTIFILNNAGYAYERLIHGLNEDYNDIAEWDYLSLPAAFGGREALRKAAEEGEEYGISCACLRTWADLDTFLQDQRFDNGFEGKAKRGLKLVDVRVGRTDVPERFKSVFEAAGESLRGSKVMSQSRYQGDEAICVDEEVAENEEDEVVNESVCNRSDRTNNDNATSGKKKGRSDKDQDNKKRTGDVGKQQPQSPSRPRSQPRQEETAGGNIERSKDVKRLILNQNEANQQLQDRPKQSGTPDNGSPHHRQFKRTSLERDEAQARTQGRDRLQPLPSRSVRPQGTSSATHIQVPQDSDSSDDKKEFLSQNLSEIDSSPQNEPAKGSDTAIQPSIDPPVRIRWKDGKKTLRRKGNSGTGQGFNGSK